MKLVKCCVAATLCIVLCSCQPRVGDCSWAGTIKAWIDENENGFWDAQEQPLPGVVITATSCCTPAVMTNPQGEASIDDAWLPGCGREGIVIVAEPPAGFRSTTPTRVSVQAGQTYSFGFAYDLHVPTATPNPVTLNCTSYTSEADLGDLFVNDIKVTSNGDAWVATNAGIAHYDRARGVWAQFEPTPTSAYSIAFGPEDTIWVGTRDAVRYGKDSIWQVYTQPDGLSGQQIYDIGVSSNGDVWFAGSGGISRLEPVTGAWESYISPAWALAPHHDGVSQNHVDSLAIAADGSVWATEFSGILSHLTFDDSMPSTAQWQDFFPPSIVSQGPSLPMTAHGIRRGPDGTLWLTGFGGLARLDPTTEDIQHYPLAPAWNPHLGDTTTAVAFVQDGDIWIGTHESGIVHFFPDNEAGVSQLLVYNVADGLVDNHVTGIAVAIDGTLWVGTFRGVSRCTPSSQPISVTAMCANRDTLVVTGR